MVSARYVGPGAPNQPAASTATVPASHSENTTVSAGGRRSRPIATHTPATTSGAVTQGRASDSSSRSRAAYR
jgi:hypothetical protein